MLYLLYYRGPRSKPTLYRFLLMLGNGNSNGSPTACSSNIRMDRHPDYYIEGGDLFLLVHAFDSCIIHIRTYCSYQVDNIFFRVHSYFFRRDSLRFEVELSVPTEAGKHRKGSSESSAIKIHDATPDEFAKFLWVFYNK